MKFTFLFFIPLVISSYETIYSIKTKFKNKLEVTKFFTKPKFYYKYLDVVDAKDINFEPEIFSMDDDVIFPQKITYYSIPKITILKISLPRVKVEQIWKKNDDLFTGFIKTKYMSFNLSVKPVLIKEHYHLILNGKIDDKKFLVPEKYLDKVLEEFCDIFLLVSENI